MSRLSCSLAAVSITAVLITLVCLLAACTPESAAPPPVPTLTPTFAASPTVLPSATPAPTLPPPPTVAALSTAAATIANTPTTAPTAAPTDTPLPPTALLNGIPVSDLVRLPPEVIDHMRQVYAEGQARGRNPYAFSKLGDSVIANADFLTRFDKPGAYTLADYDFLQPTVDQFAGSWDRFGVAIRIGLRAWGVFDPLWANKDWCEPNETMLDCEIRLNNPSILIIHLGTNDQDDTFEHFLRKTVEDTLAQGVIPVLLTKADRFEGEDNHNNLIIRQAAADYAVPLVDFDLVADTLPNRGLREDNIHLNGPMAHDYGSAEALQKGHTVHNLLVLMMLDALRQEVMQAGN